MFDLKLNKETSTKIQFKKLPINYMYQLDRMHDQPI
ncbi:hypothetical protein ABIE66_001831 [Peribacillus sp. B2I2]